MRPRYLVLLGDVQPQGADAISALEARTGLRARLVRPGLVMLGNAPCGCVALADRGVVVGTLFHRHGPSRPIDHIEEREGATIATSGGARLLDAYWGGYIAIVGSGACARILRDPSAALPCYYVRSSGSLVLSSDASLLVAAGFAGVDIHWEALARQLFSAGVPAPATGLRGVEELLPGFALEGAAGAVQAPCWSPWDHVARRVEAPEETRERLARVVRTCGEGWCGSRGRLLLSVSGGLDSSIVAACLAPTAAKTLCLTMYGEDRLGDERPYARALCRHLGLELVERPDRLEAIDVAAPLAPHLPRPSGRTQALSYERAHVEVAAEVGADAFVTGNGGDSVFGYSQSAAAVADRYLVEGVSAGLLHSLADVVRQTGCSLLEAGSAALRIVRGPRAYRCRPTTAFLHPDAVASLDERIIDHPWLRAPADALPGKAAHIAGILRVQHCLEPGRATVLPVLNPLMSQPIIETALSIPSWQWREGGWDRAVARQAFARSLPPEVARRRVKGGPDGFAARIVDRYRVAIRERLVGGRLAGQGIVDAGAVERVLGEGHLVSGEDRVRLLELLAAEAWLDHWLGGVQREHVGDGSR